MKKQVIATLLVALMVVVAFQARAVFVLPDQITVAGRVDVDGTLRTDVVQDGVETEQVSGTSGTPILNFSDLITGPDTGLGDNLGSGVIVTVWGQHIGSTQGSSVIEFCDSASVCRAGHVYYWKNADGVLPSGPANLYESHGMQEIAFSIPDSAAGAGNIRVRVGAAQTTLPFTVRTGRIVHVKTTGNDANPGTFASPLLTVDRADSGAFAQLGDTVYIHDVVTGSATTARSIYHNSGLRNGHANQYTYASYPGTRASAVGAKGFLAYISDGFVVSKLSFFSSNCNAVSEECFTVDSAGITSSHYGRVIGNTVTNQPGGCADSQAGALGSAGNQGISDAKFYGNMVHDYSCPEASKFHHTTYFTIRDVLYEEPRDETFDAFELGWNYLKDNHAKNGLHIYDEDTGSATHDRCGDLNGDLLIHDNVVVNQAGAGLEYVINCGWSQDTYIYNNLLINVGRRLDINCAPSLCGPTAAGMKIGNSNNFGDINVFNNTIYNWDVGDQGAGAGGYCFELRGNSTHGPIRINDNICYSDEDKPIAGLGGSDTSVFSVTTGSKNLFYTAAASPILPSWATENVSGNPLLTLSGARISVGAGSPLFGQSDTAPARDAYGVIRALPSTIGAIH